MSKLIDQKILNKFEVNNLFQSILVCKNLAEIRDFMRDLLTIEEIDEFARRLQVAKMLADKVPYTKITKTTGLSSTTIARIQKWLNGSYGGYRLVLSRQKNHHNSVFQNRA